MTAKAINRTSLPVHCQKQNVKHTCSCGGICVRLYKCVCVCELDELFDSKQCSTETNEIIQFQHNFNRRIYKITKYIYVYVYNTLNWTYQLCLDGK